MKVIKVVLVLVVLLPSLSFAKRKKFFNFQRKQAFVLNTQNLFQYSEFSTVGAFNLAYAYNLGNFEIQPYVTFSFDKPKAEKLSLDQLVLGLSLHFNLIENRRGKRSIPYVLVGGAYDKPGKFESGFKFQAGGGFKYFMTSRLVINPEVFYNYSSISTEGSSDPETSWKVESNINFRYYF